MKLLTSMLALAVLSVSCGKNASPDKQISNNAIIGGKLVETSQSDLIATSAVTLYTTDRTLCSGVLVSKRVVLTAAHCLVNRTVKDFESIYYFKTSTKIKNIIVHKDYDQEKQINDIGVVILAEDIQPFMKPVKIFQSAKPLIQGTPLTVAGFSVYNKPQKNDIYDVFTKLITAEYESSHKPQLFKQDVLYVQDTDNQANMYQAWGGICNGDSGGPTYVMSGAEPYLLAINGNVDANTVEDKKYSDCEMMARSTNVAPYKEWIEKQIKGAGTLAWEDATAKIPSSNVLCGNGILWVAQTFAQVFSTETCVSKEQTLSYLNQVGDICAAKCKDSKADLNKCDFFMKAKNKIADKLFSQCE